MNIHCTCEIAFQDRTALQLYEDHHITKHNYDDCTRSYAFITRSKYDVLRSC